MLQNTWRELEYRLDVIRVTRGAHRNLLVVIRNFGNLFVKFRKWHLAYICQLFRELLNFHIDKFCLGHPVLAKGVNYTEII
ncbi:hypothetical protein C0J52_08328 [Blattella germanica]|nr:hypothetical protein C0J52_08328 [Blattella germanica]